MVKSKLKQKGVSPVGVVFVMSAFAFILLLFFKLAPHYMNYFTLRSLYADVGNLPNIEKQTIRQINNTLLKRLTINSFRDFEPKKDGFLKFDEGVLMMGFDYEVKEHMGFNIDVLLTFGHNIEVGDTE